MKLNLVFENTGDFLQYEVRHNHELIEFFIDHCNTNKSNRFKNNDNLKIKIEKFLQEIDSAVSTTNKILPYLIDKKFERNINILDYLDQTFLNKQHCDWSLSQDNIVDIDNLRFSKDVNKSNLGKKLHEMYPDEIRQVRLAPILSKLNYILAYEEVNMTVHRLENSFNHLEYSAENKWEEIINPIKHFYSANDITNLYFGYTFVGRQYYNKFVNFDDQLEFNDHYNYEKLEHSFHISLSKPQTVPYSKEFIQWAELHNIPKITTSVPIANLPNLLENLFEYRKILFRNSDNYASLQLN